MAVLFTDNQHVDFNLAVFAFFKPFRLADNAVRDFFVQGAQQLLAHQFRGQNALRLIGQCVIRQKMFAFRQKHFNLGEQRVASFTGPCGQGNHCGKFMQRGIVTDGVKNDVFLGNIRFVER